MSLYIKQDVLSALFNDRPHDLSPEEVAFIGPWADKGKFIKLDPKWRNITNITPPDVCNECFDSGHSAETFLDASNGNLLVLEWKRRCKSCIGPESKAEVQALLPQAYTWVDYLKLKPFRKIDVPVEVQQILIDQIKNGELDGHSVLLCGPSRVGKSVLASALLSRMVHKYICNGFFVENPFWPLPIYRTNADLWIDRFEAWKHHPFDSRAPRPEPPKPDAETIIRQSTRAFPPVLILEEVDKFSNSDFKLRSLQGLLNAIFESGGMIVSTANLGEAALKDRFPDWFWRRLVESARDHVIRVKDFHHVVAKAKVRVATKPKAGKAAGNRSSTDATLQ